MSYGYRLFEVRTFESNSGRKPRGDDPEIAPWKLNESTHFSAHARDLFDQLVTTGRSMRADIGWTAGHDSPEIPDDPGRRGDAVIHWQSVEGTGRHLSLKVSHGYRGRHNRELLSAGSRELEGTASVDLRAELLLPEQAGAGLLVVEAIGTQCPYVAFPRWLTVCSTVTNSKLEDVQPRRVEIAPFIDNVHLTDLLNRTKKATLKLRGAGPSPSGIRRGRQDVEVLFKLGSRQQGGLLQTVRLGNRIGTTPTDALVAIGQQDTFGDFEFQDGTISLTTTDGEYKTMPLANPEEIFIYPTTKDIPPSDWTDRVKKKIEQVRPDLDW